MAKQQVRILVCDDQATIRSSLIEALSDEGYKLVEAADGKGALDAVRDEEPDLVLLDLKLPDISGVDVLRTLRGDGFQVPVILMTAYGDLATAVEAMKLGAYDFVQKPYSLSEMKNKVAGALKVRKRLRTIDQVNPNVALDSSQYLAMLQDTPGMEEVVEKINKVGRSRAGNEVSVLIQGESGCGKELVARAIHEVSHPGAPFMEINCAAVPDTLLESELFGHEKGAFTDARAAKEGLFELAARGTIFLDEIGELPFALQVKLLRALQEGEFEPIGSSRTRKVDVRVIAATNSNDTVPRFLASGRWNPNPTVATITNAMDVSLPNNFPRVLELGEGHGLPLETLLSSTSLDDDETSSAIRDLYAMGYLADPHSALAWAALNTSLRDDEEGVFLCTAHPAKFLETMEATLGVEIPIPPELAAVQNEPLLSSTISGDFEALKRELEPLRN